MLQSPEKKRGTGLQSACERSSEKRESGRVFLTVKEWPKIGSPPESGWANVKKCKVARGREENGKDLVRWITLTTRVILFGFLFGVSSFHTSQRISDPAILLWYWWTISEVDDGGKRGPQNLLWYWVTSVNDNHISMYSCIQLPSKDRKVSLPRSHTQGILSFLSLRLLFSLHKLL